MHVPQDSMWRVLRKKFWQLNRPEISSKKIFKIVQVDICHTVVRFVGGGEKSTYTAVCKNCEKEIHVSQTQSTEIRARCASFARVLTLLYKLVGLAKRRGKNKQKRIFDKVSFFFLDVHAFTPARWWVFIHSIFLDYSSIILIRLSTEKFIFYLGSVLG